MNDCDEKTDTLIKSALQKKASDCQVSNEVKKRVDQRIEEESKKKLNKKIGAYIFAGTSLLVIIIAILVIAIGKEGCTKRRSFQLDK